MKLKCSECKGTGKAQEELFPHPDIDLDQNCVYCDGVGVCDNKKDER